MVTPQNQNSGSAYIKIGYIACAMLFIACVVILFSNGLPIKNTPTPAGNITSDSSLTSTKKDTLKTEAGKSVTVTSVSNTTKYTTVAPQNNNDVFFKNLEALYKYFILIFGLLILLIVIPRLKNFEISNGSVKGEFYELAKAINATQNNAIQQADGAISFVKTKLKNAGLESITTTTQNDDPQKGLWGGEDEKNNRKITASIKQIIGSEWANITLQVFSTDEAEPLTGVVYFHLHPTFPNSVRAIIAIDGVAELSLKAWGAFTVGAECDEGRTRLELDLSKHPSAFAPFKDR